MEFASFTSLWKVWSVMSHVACISAGNLNSSLGWNSYLAREFHRAFHHNIKANEVWRYRSLKSTKEFSALLHSLDKVALQTHPHPIIIIMLDVIKVLCQRVRSCSEPLKWLHSGWPCCGPLHWGARELHSAQTGTCGFYPHSIPDTVSFSHLFWRWPRPCLH